MALTIDGFAILRNIGKHGEAFSSLTAEVNKAAQALVVKHIGAKTVDLSGLRQLHALIGERDFALVVDAMKDSEVKRSLTNIDKHCPETKTASATWRQDRLRALAAGTVEPVPPPERPARARSRSEPKKVGGAGRQKGLKSAAMAAVREK